LGNIYFKKHRLKGTFEALKNEIKMRRIMNKFFKSYSKKIEKEEQ